MVLGLDPPTPRCQKHVSQPEAGGPDRATFRTFSADRWKEDMTVK